VTQVLPLQQPLGQLLALQPPAHIPAVQLSPPPMLHDLQTAPPAPHAVAAVPTWQ
jgi:hypothetical protein